MNKLMFKKLNKIFAVMFFMLASFVLSMSFALTISSVAKADDSDYYAVNLTATNGTATLTYQGNDYSDLENIFVKGTDGNYKILKSVVDDTENVCKIKVEAVANKNYILGSILVNGSAITSEDNTFTISSGTAKTNVVVNFDVKKFNVKVEAMFSGDGENFTSDNTLLTNNMGKELDALRVDAFATIFNETNNVVANDRDSDHLEFVGYFIKDVNGNKVNVSSSRKIASLEFDEEFIDTFLGEKDTLEIVAEYQYKRAINVSVDSSCSSYGTYDVILRDKNNNAIEFVSGEYYSAGTKISIVPTASKYHEFSYFLLNGEKKFDSNLSLKVENSDINLVLFFDKASYELSFNIVNSVYGRLGNEEIQTEITRASGYHDSPVAKKVVIGDTINSIKFNNIYNYNDYRFLAWKLISKNNEEVSVSSPSNVNVVENLRITSEFVDKYVIDGKIQFYGVFVQQCQLSIVMQKTYDTDKTFEIYENGTKVTDLSKSFDYGTILTITVPIIDHMIFDHFDGLVVNDQYTSGQTTAQIVMNGNRSISASYRFVETEIKLSNDSYSKNANLVLNLDKVKIGDTLIINAKLLNGYKLKSFSINGSSVKSFVKALNNLGDDTVANFDENGIVTIYVNRDVYDFLTVHSELKVEVDSKVNGTYIVLFVIYIVLAIGLGAVIIVLSIKTNNYSEEIKKLQRQKQEEIRKKEEEQRLEEEKERARKEKALQAEKASETSEKEKPKKVATKKATKPKAEKPTETKKTASKPKTASKTGSTKPKTENKTQNSAKKPATKKVAKKTETKEIEGGKA